MKHFQCIMQGCFAYGETSQAVDKPLRGSSTVFLMQAWRSRPACKVSKLTHMSSAWTDFIVFPKFLGFSGMAGHPAMRAYIWKSREDPIMIWWKILKNGAAKSLTFLLQEFDDFQIDWILL